MTLDLKAKCQFGGLATQVCTSIDCYQTNPFVCNRQCTDGQCYQNHGGCKLISWTTCKKKLTISSVEKSSKLEEFIEEISGLYDKLVSMVEGAKQQFELWHQNIGLNPKIAKFFKLISQGSYSMMTGSMVGAILHEGNPQVNIKVKNLTKIDNFFFREIEALQSQALEKIRQIYMGSQMTQYYMKNDHKEQEKQKEQPKFPADDYYQRNQQIVMKIQNSVKHGELDLRDIFTDQANIKLLQYLDLSQVNKIDLTDNSLSNLDWLPRLIEPKFSILLLDYNSIVDLSPLTKCNFRNLQSLHLQYNQIVSLQPFLDTSFPRLKILHLNYNQINSIQCLPLVKWPMIKTLLLYDNSITDIEPLTRTNFKNLTTLHIYGNKFDRSSLNKHAQKLRQLFRNISFKFQI